MIKSIVRDIFFLGQKSEPATRADLQVGRSIRQPSRDGQPRLRRMRLTHLNGIII